MLATILDTETTGFPQNRSIKLELQPEVIEYFSATTNLATGERIGSVSRLIKPAKLPLPAKIIEITGITDAMLADQPPFTSRAAEIQHNIESSEVCIAHNASFDREMLDIEFERLGIKLKWPRVICTVEATIHIKGYRLNMAKLHRMLFDEDFKDAHRAENDVNALERCCVELFKQGKL